MSTDPNELKVSAAEVSGCAVLAEAIGQDVSSASKFLGEHGTPLGDFSGDIMQTLLSPLESFKTMTQSRFDDLSARNN